MADVLQTALILECIFIPESIIETSQHWFMLWLGGKQAQSHYLNQCRHILLEHMHHQAFMS